MVKIEHVDNADKRIPLSLLLEADPDEVSVEAYLRRSRVMLAIVSGCIVGVIVYELQRKEARLWNIAVIADHRRSGVASELMRMMCRQLQSLSIGSVFVGTGNSSIGPLTFYQRLGFRIESVNKDYFASYDPPIYENGIRCLDMIILRYSINTTP